MKKIKGRLFLIVIFFILFLSVIFFSSIVFAQTNETAQVNMAYNWLSSKLDNASEWALLSVEESAFSLLALSYDNTIAQIGKNALTDKSKNKTNDCWPASGCKVKDTALAIFTLSSLCVDTSRAEDWLMTRSSTPAGIEWYLQIDSNEKTTCTISYDSKDYTIAIGEDKKIDKNAGSCLTLAYNNNWLRINAVCTDKTFTVSCDKSFLTSLLYKKTTESTIYVSSDTKTESANGIIETKINAICLKEGTTCNYEATAWAALALAKKGKDISVFLPYLIIFADDNEKYFPDAFLLMLTGNDDYATSIVEAQKTGYWKAPASPYNEYYDTALALMALKSHDYISEKIDNAKKWLLGKQIKTGNDAGSWRSSKKETAFILFSTHGWYKSPLECLGGEQLLCEDYGYVCTAATECDNVIENYFCSGTDICCQQSTELKSCSDIGGVICSARTICKNGIERPSSNGDCCTGTCEKETENECEDERYTCRDECNEDEEDVYYDCSQAGEVCCKSESVVNECEDEGYLCRDTCAEDEDSVSYSCLISSEFCCAPKTPIEKKSRWWLWILLLLLLIGAVLFFLMRMRGRGIARKPRFPPTSSVLSMAARPLPPRKPLAIPPMRPMQLPVVSGRPFIPRRSVKKTETDKELEETLKKLEEIGEEK